MATSNARLDIPIRASSMLSDLVLGGLLLMRGGDVAAAQVQVQALTLR
jgi:hypothetical protein